ncbi:hypothetical protein [Ruminococcus sp.]|uniref:hypothetical protein n=1 Tax=Ruminococcus sp. TaxID=41978 RepID=UPI0025E52852|nr:hypothetical protein [Ruminococcus sp.]MBQ8965122.1 hypothetical protein [Ruminococcus sp.]
MERKDYKAQVIRSFAELAVLVLLTADIARGNTVMWSWLAVRAAVLIEYVSFSLKDEIKDIIKNFISHVLTGAVLAFAWYGAYVLFELKSKFFDENTTVLHVTVPTCIKWCALLSVIGLTVSAVMYIVRQKRSGF